MRTTLNSVSAVTSVTASALNRGAYRKRVPISISALFFTVFLLSGPIDIGASTAPAILPNLQLTRGGIVNAMAFQPDGKLVVGGDFTSVNGIPRRHLARLNADGTLDTGWNPAPSGPISILLTNDDALFVMGTFTNIGGLERNGLARINLDDGSVDAMWNPNPNSPPSVLAVAGADVFVSGSFNSIGGQTRNRLAKINANGAGLADLDWNPGMSGFASAMTVNDTNLYIGGYFYEVGGISRTSIARLSASGVGLVDPVWAPKVASGSTFSAIIVNQTNVYVSGCFFSGTISGLGRIAVPGSGGFDPNWNPHPTGPTCFVRALAIDGTNLYVGGNFSAISGVNRRGIARISLLDSGVADPAWNANVDNSVSAILKGGTNLYIGGLFGYASNSLALGLAKLDLDSGQRVMAYAPQIQLPGKVFALAIQPAGRVIVGGQFDMAGAVPKRNLVRVNTDGSLDLIWSPDPNGRITTLLIHSNELFASGFFSKIRQLNRNQLAKVSLSGAGEADMDWDPGMDVDINSRVNSLAALGTNLFVGGSFKVIGGQARSGLAKLSTQGAGLANADWNPTPYPCCSWFLVESVVTVGSHLFVSGVFTNVGGLDRKHIAKLSMEGTGLADATWNPDPTGGYVDLLLSDGSTNLFVSGGFTNIGGQNRLHYAKLSTEGTGPADPTWNQSHLNTRLLAVAATNLYAGGPSQVIRLSTIGDGSADPNWNPSPNGVVSAIAVNDADVYVGGDFTTVGGVQRNGFAYFNNFLARPILRNPSFGPNGFSFEIVLEPDQTNRLQMSADLTSWFDLTTISSSTPIFTFTDAIDLTGSNRFFRTVSP